MTMPAQGRKPLGEYSGMDENSSSPPGTPDTSSRSSQPRSSSPGKKPTTSSLYPVQELSKSSQEYDHKYPKHIPSVYPDIDRENKEYIDRNEKDSVLRSRPTRKVAADGLLASGDTVESDSRSAPVPKPRTSKSKKVPGVVETDGGVPVPPQDNAVPLVVLVGFVTFSIVVCFTWPYIVGWFKWYVSPSNEQINLDRFDNEFRRFQNDFKDDIHPDSMRTLQSALRHHVESASNEKEKYPTCLLVAGDRTGSHSLNCLARRIAEMIPAPHVNTKNSNRENVYTVNLTDTSHHHTNPDNEDRRSRVHSGINESLDKGTKIIVFLNLEALIPNDIPLLQLFYSYCDGENPTFPKTLWILTLGTSNVAYEDEMENKQPGFAKKLVKKVEKYLGDIIDSATQRKDDVNKVDDGNSKDQKAPVNPLLTRIANYIIPVLKTKKDQSECKV